MLWLLATATIWLEGCAAPKLDTQNYAYGVDSCDGSLGSFDVYLVNNSAQGDATLVIVPIALTLASTDITVTVSTPSTDRYLTLINEVMAVPDQQIQAGPLNSAQLQTFTELAIAPYGNGVPFPDQTPAYSTVCAMPQLGDGIYGSPAQPTQ
jgi:hypothetical protein